MGWGQGEGKERGKVQTSNNFTHFQYLPQSTSALETVLYLNNFESFKTMETLNMHPLLILKEKFTHKYLFVLNCVLILAKVFNPGKI